MNDFRTVRSQMVRKVLASNLVLENLAF